MTHDTHKETIKDITIGTKQFNCDQLFKEGRSADPCGVVVPQWPGWLEYNCIQSSHGPAPRQCRGAGARWRHDNYLHWQQGSRQDRSRRHGNTLRLCRNNLPKWMRKSVWPGQKSFNVKILNYLCVEVIWFLSRSIMFCLLSDANTWHCSYKSVHSRCFCDNRPERARAQASCDTLHLGAGAWAPPTGTQQHSMER